MLSVSQSSIESFRRHGLPALAESGWVEGRNLVFDARSTDGRLDLLKDHAAELVLARPDAAIAVSNPVAMALRAADPALPIVMGFAGNDPVTDRLVTSIARPGTSVTGVLMLADELNVKRIELARELLPGVSRIGYLIDVHLSDARIAFVRTAAERLGIELVTARARAADRDRLDLEATFQTLRSAGVQVVAVASSPVLSGAAQEVAARALESRLPTVAEWRGMAETGCMASYGPQERDLRRLIADFVVRILRGARAAEMPMQAPTRFELIINLGTARRLGLTLPTALLARADEVIE
jgi:putative ABC transport system substrate-binding protein